MSDASSIRKISTPLAPSIGGGYPAPGTLPSEAQVGSGFYESAIRFQLNPAGYNYTYTDSNNISRTRNTGQAYVNSGAQWVPLGNVVLSVNAALATEAVDQNIFIADRPYNVVAVGEVHGTAEATATTLTAQVNKCTGTTVAGSGSNVLTSTFNLKGTANTVQNGTLSATLANTQLAAGDRLALHVSGAATELAGVVINIVLQPQ